jgi:hypothetical protein
VSPTYTLLELWRVNQGLPAPDFSKEIDLTGTGADSATAAVEEAAQALARYDVDGFLDLLSPDEAAALYHYRDAIVSSLHQDGALAELQSETQLTVEAVNATAGDEVDDRVPVTIRSANGSLADDRNFITWTLDRNCLSYVENGDPEGGCLDQALTDAGVRSEVASEFPSLTLLTQEVDGRWYLSPMATVVAETRRLVARLDADDVASLLHVPQFGGVDGQLEEGKTLDGSVEQPYDYALYEMDVPAGKVFSPCVDNSAGWSIYGPDGRPTSSQAVLAEDAGRYRVLVVGGESGSFSISPTLSSVEEVTVPSTVPAAGGGACGARMLSFDATAGEVVLFGTENDDLVEILTPSGETVWTSVFEPAETGRHFLNVAADQDVDIETLPADVLTVGSSVTGTVAGSQPSTMRVFVPAGQEVAIEVEGEGSVYPYVELLTLDGSTVSSDSPGYYYSTATVFPYYESSAQMYELSVEDYFGESGTFRVTVVPQ